MRDLVEQRRFGDVVRLEIAHKASRELVDFLARRLRLQPFQIYRIKGPMGFSEFMTLYNVDRPQLKTPGIQGHISRLFQEGDMFGHLRKRDVVLFHPYDSFKAVLDFIRRACGRVWIPPRVIICVPTGISEVQMRAIMDASREAGARRTYLIDEPRAAALGARLKFRSPVGHMIVNIGGGISNVAVLSMGGVVVSDNIPVGGDRFDQAIMNYVRRRYGVLIGERTAEDIKIKIGSAYKRPEPDYMEVRGRNLVTGLPKTIKVSSEETEEALKESTMQIVEAIHGVLEKTPPELAADIADRGIVLTGGGSLLRGLEELIAEHTGINTMTAEDPMTAVAIGTGKYVEFLGGYRE